MVKIDLSSSELSEKEQRIIESAIKIFSEKGFSAATTSEIAKDAGVAEGTIFRYFKTKKDILRGILIQAIQILSGKLVMSSIEKILLTSEDKDLREILKEVLCDRLNLVDSIFPMARVVLTEALYHEDIREAIFENIISKALDLFIAFHKKMVEKGMMRQDIEPVALLRSILGNIAVIIAQKKLFSDKLPIEDLDKEFDQMLDVLLYGFAKRPDSHRTQHGLDQS